MLGLCGKSPAAEGQVAKHQLGRLEARVFFQASATLIFKSVPFPSQREIPAGAAGLEPLLALCQHHEIKEKLDNTQVFPNNFFSILREERGERDRIGDLPSFPGSQNLKSWESLLTTQSAVHWPQARPGHAGN